MSKELIERLRMMSADTYGNDAADALESLEADRDSWERQAGDRLDDVLRVVAERDALANCVYQLEQKNSGAAEIIAAMQETHAEDQAELKALREQKPVARIDDDENFQGPCRHAMAFVPMHRGAPLYARPVPGRELTDADIALCIASADKSFAQERISGKPVLGVWSKHLARAIERHLKGESE